MECLLNKHAFKCLYWINFAINFVRGSTQLDTQLRHLGFQWFQKGNCLNNQHCISRLILETRDGNTTLPCGNTRDGNGNTTLPTYQQPILKGWGKKQCIFVALKRAAAEKEGPKLLPLIFSDTFSKIFLV